MIRSYRCLWWPLKIAVWALPGLGLLAIGYAAEPEQGAGVILSTLVGSQECA